MYTTAYSDHVKLQKHSKSLVMRHVTSTCVCLYSLSRWLRYCVCTEVLKPKDFFCLFDLFAQIYYLLGLSTSIQPY